MSRIDELIAELAPEGVRFDTIGQLAEVTSGATPSKSVSDYWIDGTIPWLSSGEVNKGTIYEADTLITQAGYDSCSTRMMPSGSVVMALAGQGKTRGMVARTRLECCTNQSLATIVPKLGLDSDFLFYYLKTQYAKLRDVSSGDGTRGGLNLAMIRAYRIPVPPLEVQREIVRVLDQFTQLEAELEAELEARRRQYEHYRQRELTFDGSVPRAALSELARVKTGSPVSKQTIQRNPGPYPVINSGREPLGFIGEFNTERDPLGVTSRGAGVGSITWCDGPYFRGNLNYGVTIKDPSRVNVRFLYHLLQHLQPQIHALCSFQGIPALNKANLDKLIVPLPSFSSQVKIVDLLDKFDALVSDLSVGLPAELAARRKQYEYYRDKLLTFEEAAA